MLDGHAFQIGLGMGVASMLSIGPNNLMMIREGLCCGRVLLVPSLVLGCETTLIVGSFILASTLSGFGEDIRTPLSWAGVAALCWFAAQSLRAATRLPVWSGGGGEPLRACLARVMGTVCTNPLAWLEMLLVPAAISQSFATTDDRIAFAAGIVLANAVGAYAFTFGARAIALALGRVDLRLLDLGSGLILSAVALSFAIGLVS